MYPYKKGTDYLFTFLRHGESVGNAENYHQGHVDFPLTDLGRTQANKIGVYLEEKSFLFDRMISSPLIRASETANIINSYLHLDIEFDEIWMERDNGKLGGLSHEEALSRKLDPHITDLHTPVGETGESHMDLFIRAGNAVQTLLHREPGSYLIISHGALLNRVLRNIMGIDLKTNSQGTFFWFKNTAFTTMLYRPAFPNWTLLEFHPGILS